MKKIIYILLWLTPLSPAFIGINNIFAQIRRDFTVNFEGVNREFIVVRPSGVVPAGGYPVVFMLHGTSGDGEKFYQGSGWKEKGEAEKFIRFFHRRCGIVFSIFPTRIQS